MLNKIYKAQRAIIFLFLLWACCLSAAARAESSAPQYLTYSELTSLYEREILSAPLESKLNKLLTTPFVNNSYRVAEPLRLWQSPQLGEFLRVVHWNIERGLEYEALEAAFGGEEQLAGLLDNEKFPAGSEARNKIMEEAALLRTADVIILNEVDWGLKRTDYRSVVSDLAARLKMNYAFGVQFVELSPVHLSQEPARADAAEKEISQIIKVDPERYKGLHGVAILSRFPLENVRLVPFKAQPYDWYKSEKKGVSLLEKSRRKIANKVFLSETLREVRRGGRTMLLADISDARLPAGRATIVSTHLENRTKPSGRVRQLEELLATIKDIKHPVIVAGDMNTSSEDLTPTSFRREFIKRYGNPQYWIKKGIAYTLGFGLIEDVLMGGVTFWRQQSDPTVRHIPFISPNPSQKFFTTLKKFRFEDGGAFDFRGNPSRSTNYKSKTLSDSNERGEKGFVATYQVNRPIKFVGKYKLDWIFVKPANIDKPNDRNASYRFAPHFGRTLLAINRAVEDRISDHRPMLVDLPLSEPLINEKRR